RLLAAPARLHEALLERAPLRLQRVEVRERAGGLLAQRALDRRVDLLAQPADAYAARPYHAPAVGLVLAREQAQECRLAGAVRADDSEPVAGVHLERHVREQAAGSQRADESLGAQQHGGKLAGAGAAVEAAGHGVPTSNR